MDIMSSGFVQEMFTIEDAVVEKIAMGSEGSVAEDQLIFVEEDKITFNTDPLVKMSVEAITEELEKTIEEESKEYVPGIPAESIYFPSEEDVENTDISQDDIVEPTEFILESKLQEIVAIKKTVLENVTATQEIETVPQNVIDIKIVQEFNLDDVEIVSDTALEKGTGIMIESFEEGIDVIGPSREVKDEISPEILEEVNLEQMQFRIQSEVSLPDVHIAPNSIFDETISNFGEKSYSFNAISGEIEVRTKQDLLPVISEASIEEVLELTGAHIDQAAVTYETLLEEIAESSDDEFMGITLEASEEVIVESNDGVQLVGSTLGVSEEEIVASSGILVDEEEVKLEALGSEAELDEVTEVQIPSEISFKDIVELSEADVEEEDNAITHESPVEVMNESIETNTEKVTITDKTSVEEVVDREFARKLESSLEVELEEDTVGYVIKLKDAVVKENEVTVTYEGSVDNSKESSEVGEDYPILFEAQAEYFVQSTEYITGGELTDAASEEKVVVKREAPVMNIDDSAAAVTEEFVVTKASAKEYIKSVGAVLDEEEGVITSQVLFEEISSAESDSGKFSIIYEDSTGGNLESTRDGAQKEDVAVIPDMFGEEVELPEVVVDEVSEIFESLVGDIVESASDLIEEIGTVPKIIVDELSELTVSVAEDKSVAVRSETLFEEIVEPSEVVTEVTIVDEVPVIDILESTTGLVIEEIAITSELLIDEAMESGETVINEVEVIIESFVEELVESIQDVIEEVGIAQKIDKTLESAVSVFKEEAAVISEGPVEELNETSKDFMEDTSVSAEVPKEENLKTSEPVVIEDFAIEMETQVEEIAESMKAVTEKVSFPSEGSSEQVVEPLEVEEIEDFATKPESLVEEIVDFTEFSITIEGPAESMVEPIGYVDVETPYETESLIEEVIDSTKGFVTYTEDTADEIMESSRAAIVKGEIVISTKHSGQVEELQSAVTDKVATTLEPLVEETVAPSEAFVYESLEVTDANIVEEEITIPFEAPYVDIVSTEEVANKIEISVLDILETPTSVEDEKQILFPEGQIEYDLELTQAVTDEIILTPEAFTDDIVESARAAFEEDIAITSDLPGEEIIEIVEAITDEVEVVCEACVEGIKVALEVSIDNLFTPDVSDFEELEAPVETLVDSHEAPVEAEASDEKIMVSTEDVIEKREIFITPETFVEEILEFTEDDIKEVVTAADTIEVTVKPAETLDESGGVIEAPIEEIVYSSKPILEVPGQGGDSLEEIIESTKAVIEDEVSGRETADVPEMVIEEVETLVEEGKSIKELELTAKASVDEFVESANSVVGDEKNAVELEASVEEIVEGSNMVTDKVAVATETSADEEAVDSSKISVEEVAELNESITEKDDTFAGEIAEEVIDETIESAVSVEKIMELTRPTDSVEELVIIMEAQAEGVVQPSEAVVKKTGVITDTLVEEILDEVETADEEEVSDTPEDCTCN
ncbi:microtubule-associated protein futsch-like [Palaemon carinicauda]|uniref:microtubule-associated protein futsch-like n=1 Tax=Palaemon carinicauda TaxID=392227 RepID=UPI0035B5CCDB